MSYVDSFLEIFGNVTVADVVKLIIAVSFVVFVAKKIGDYLIKRHEAEKLKDAQIKEALDAVHKYPEYRRQSLEIQKEFQKETESLRKAQENILNRIKKMEDDQKRRERSRLRECLLRNYRYFTSNTKNPMLAWTRMESDAFWEQFKDYTDAGGNGHVHSEVQPAMRKLEVIEMTDTERITELMHSRG